MNVTRLGFVFVLILFFVLSHARSIRKRRVRLKLYVQGQEGEKISDVYGQGVTSLENWTIFMDVICVLFLIAIV